MFTSMQEIYEAEPRSELIEPFSIKESDLISSQIVPIVVMGIFNPMGPTIVALNLLSKQDASSDGILYTILNPFIQKRLLIARLVQDADAFTEFLPTVYQAGEETLLGALPDFVMCASSLEPVIYTVNRLIRNLADKVPSEEPMEETISKIKKHWRDPWNRIPSMSEALQKELSSNDTNPSRTTPSGKVFKEWYSLITEPGHLSVEVGAIIQGWQGAIEFQGGALPSTPFEEVIDELSFLGHPLFQELQADLLKS